MQSDKIQIKTSTTSLSAFSGLVERYANPEFSIAPGGHVQTISAGHYTVSGLSRHVRLGDFVAHKSATGTHLGEVIKVEPETVFVCPIEPATRSASTIPSSARAPSALRRPAPGAAAPSTRSASRSMAASRCCRATSAARSPIPRRRR